MKVAITGATGFLGRYILERLISAGQHCRCWFRPDSDRGGLEKLAGAIEWIPGGLGDTSANRALVSGCDALVHAALDYPDGGPRKSPQFVNDLVMRNVVGTLGLIAAAREAGVERYVIISSCAVHDRILDDRPLDEKHPCFPTTHYGAHKAAIEAFVHSYGWGENLAICALRPTGIYGVAHPIAASKWQHLIQAVVRGEGVQCHHGGKEVHAGDVAQAVELLLSTPNVAGEAYNCYDRYVSEYEVAALAKEISGSKAEILGQPGRPQHEIVTDKLRALGMQFGGRPRLEETIRSLVDAIRRSSLSN